MSGELPIPVFTHPRMLGHDPGAGHPERPDRLGAALAAVRACEVGIEERPAREITREELEWLHTPAYVESILELAGKSRSLDADTHLSPGSVLAAQLAASAAIKFVDSLLAPRPRIEEWCSDGPEADRAIGLLPVREHRAGRGSRGGSARSGAGDDHRLGCPPR